YSTAAPFGPALPRRGGHLQYLIGQEGDPAEVVLHYAREPQVSAPDGVRVGWDGDTGQLRLNLTPAAAPIQVDITGAPVTSEGTGTESLLALRLISRAAAGTTWFLGGRPADRMATTPGSADAHVVVEGAELARTVAFSRADADVVVGTTDDAQ